MKMHIKMQGTIINARPNFLFSFNAMQICGQAPTTILEIIASKLMAV
jgi:hypothetical protein